MGVFIQGWRSCSEASPRRSWRCTAEPAQEPIDLDEVKHHCRALMDVHDEDGLLRSYLRAARLACEAYIERALFTSTWVLTQDDFSTVIDLPMADPLQSVTSVKYYDVDGNQQTLSTTFYRVDTESSPGRVVLKPEQTWPVVQWNRGQSVEITYVAGWSSVEMIPENLKIGMLMVINHLTENRGAVQIGIGVGAVEVPMGVTWWWGPYQRVLVA